MKLFKFFRKEPAKVVPDKILAVNTVLPMEWCTQPARTDAAAKVVHDPVFRDMIATARAHAIFLIAASQNDSQVKRLQVFDQVAGYLQALRTLEKLGELNSISDFQLQSRYGLDDKLIQTLTQHEEI